jgi:putative DNA primase/helicase
MSTGDVHNDFERRTKVEWPDPQPLPGGLPGVPAFDEHLLPDALRPWLTDIAERAQVPLDFPAAAVIVPLSSALGRRCGIYPKRHDDWLVVPNLGACSSVRLGSSNRRC